MKKTLLLLHICLLVFACNTSPEQSDGYDSVSFTQADSISIINDFKPFFERFKNDSAFQVENVKFPYTAEMWELGTEKPEVAKILKDEWRHLKFQYDSSYTTRQIDAYTQEIKSYGDTVKIELRGVDNGIMIDYEFVKINGQWLLVAEKDYSS